MNKGRDYSYHQWSLSDLEKYFDIDLRLGMSKQRAERALQKYGENSLTNLKEQTIWSILGRQFANFFVILLFVAAIISYFAEGMAQSVVLVAIIIVNISLGFFQEYKAEKSLSRLKNSLAPMSRVIRDGLLQKIDSRSLVPGDVIALEAGDKVPADVRIIEEQSLRIDESSLTGESVPISKTVKTLGIDTNLGDRRNIAFSSGVVVSGHGKGVVVATGNQTEFGKIAKLVSFSEDETPLEKQVTYLGKILTYIAFALCSVLFFIGYFRDLEVLELLTFTIALLIAVVPESLPTAITLSLAIGMNRMAEKRAIVRRMAVVETLGTTNLIATDKTGTLTNNKLSISQVLVYQNGLILPASISEKSSTLMRVLSYGITCSNFDLNAKELTADPLELAIVNLADELDNLKAYKGESWRKNWEMPFDSDNKYMAVSATSNNANILIVKGAPEVVLRFCKQSSTDKKLITKESNLLSKQGYKVIAIATKDSKKSMNSAISELNFCALLAIADEPSLGIKETLDITMKAGIKTVILTGDHPETARFIAEKVGIKISDDEIATSDLLAKMSKSELKKVIERVKIFARVTPEDKINLVKLFKSAGYSVAMTGDGVNDAPALKEAHVGIAMGIRGTDVAKESADIILSDDQYSTIVSAIEYGRSIYDNIKNVVIQLISGNFNEIFLVFVAFIFGLPLPLITIQILWINLIIESFAALSLSFEKPGRQVLSESPRPVGSDSLRGSIGYAISLALSSCIFGLAIYLWGLTYSVSLARTLVFCFIVLSEAAFSLSIRSNKRIWESPKNFLDNKYLLLSFMIIVILQSCLFISPFSQIFGIVALDTSKIAVLVLATVAIFLTAEIIRYYHDKETGGKAMGLGCRKRRLKV